MNKKALIIDDEADIRELIAMSLDRIGLDTHTAINLGEARNLLDNYKFDVCLTDMKLPDGNGLDFVKYANKIQPELPVAVITAHGNMQAAVEAMKNGAFDFVSKPVDLGLLRSLVVQAMSTGLNIEQTPATISRTSATPAGQTHSDRSNRTSSSNDSRINETQQRIASYTGKEACTGNSELPGLVGEERLIGQSEPMQVLKKMILKVARTNAPVWITGESGTGKELVAKLIHDNGPRVDAPFIAINCGAIPSELMESEMFGHRKGSFTGAHDDHDGLFKRAQGGTLFLDEVAELPLHMQVKLLRAIQERKVRPVGSSEEIGTNVRILSASHTDLSIEVDEGRFRHDLYYRLNVICIRSPNLRQRSNDVPLIARHILTSIARSEGHTHVSLLTPEAENLLCAYSFPGNVRELENILERAVALSDADLIEASDLNVQLHPDNAPASDEPTATNTTPGNNQERQTIIEALSRNRWNRKATATALGMTYRQLRYRIQQYGIGLDG